MNQLLREIKLDLIFTVPQSVEHSSCVYLKYIPEAQSLWSQNKFNQCTIIY